MDEKHADIVTWDNKYATGIKLIDSQHKQLFDLTNNLHKAYFEQDEALYNEFKDSMSRLVEYVHFHFDAEFKILNKINYPDYHNHKKQHDSFILEILDAAKDYREGKKNVPIHFVRTLKDWILGHIGVYDKAYSDFAKTQVKKGILTEKDMREIE